jgi:hypothetical protein
MQGNKIIEFLLKKQEGDYIPVRLGKRSGKHPGIFGRQPSYP